MKIKKERAAKSPIKTSFKAIPLFTFSEDFKITANVLTTFSLAKIPAIVATIARQFPKPKGIKKLVKHFPNCANKEFSCETKPNPLVLNPKFIRNQIKILAKKITVPAFVIKDLTFKNV